MPELPDVEVNRRYLEANALGQRIERTHVEERMLHGTTPQGLGRALKGAAFATTSRHGKYLFAGLDSGGWLVLHFGMTGRLERVAPGGAAPEHTQCAFVLANGFELAYAAPRKLGRISLTDSPETFVAELGLGPDALTLGVDDFLRLAASSRAGVKSWLMNQATMAGVGNVYSDEALLQAGIHPRRALPDLDEDALRRLHRELHRVLEDAIAAGADPGRMPPRFLLPHRGAGGRCPRCGGPIEKISASGRSAWRCPACQPA